MPRARVVHAASGLLVASGLFFVWRRSLPGFIHEKSHVPTGALLGQALLVTLEGARLLALLLMPAVVLADPRRLWRRARTSAPRASRAVAWVITVLAGGSVLQRASHAALLGPGDYVVPGGVLGTGTLGGVRPDLLPRWLLLALAAAGACALVILGAILAAWLVGASRRPPAHTTAREAAPLVVALAATGYVVSCVFAVAVGYSRFFDRYLIPIVPLVAMLVLRSSAPERASRGVRVAGCIALAGMAGFGAVYAANSAAYDGAKWRVASRAVAFAPDAMRVDGGRVWNDSAAGRHRRGRFPDACVVVRAEAAPAGDAPDVVAASPVWGAWATQTWVVARRVPGAGCQRRT
jgi:hypothetical protein